MGDSLPAPRSSSGEERRLVGTGSLRRWIWSVGGETERGEAVEVEVFASGRGTGAECKVEIMADFDPEFGAVAAAGRSVGPGNNSALEVGEVQVEDTEKTETRAGVESVIVKGIVMCPWCLSGLLERWCCGQGRGLKLRCLGLTGAAGCLTEGSPLEQKQKTKNQSHFTHFTVKSQSTVHVHLISPFSCPSSSSLSVLLSFSASLSSRSLPGPGLCGGRDSALTR